MFKNLKVVGLGASTSYQPTIASILNPLNLLKAVNAIRHPPTKDILSGFEGVVRPGEMLCTYSHLTLKSAFAH
jgi:ATP-binding cassette subfamily G (WHITE) protein 2 (SNQ2)